MFYWCSLLSDVVVGFKCFINLRLNWVQLGTQHNSTLISKGIGWMDLLLVHSWYFLAFYRYPSVIKGNNGLPPEDRLLKFLVDNNADAEEIVQCANCDQESNKKVQTSQKQQQQRFFFFLLWQILINPLLPCVLSFNRLFVFRTQVWCSTATLVTSLSAAPAGSSHTRPECSPTTTLSHYLSAAKPSTGSVVRDAL